MEAINSSSFFHYRSKKEDFYKIIKEGFHYRYSFEPLGTGFANADKNSDASTLNIMNSFAPLLFDTKDSKDNSQDEDSKGIAIPMLCFCDIPILRAGKHRMNYGNYCIGMDKEMMIKRLSPMINPIFYVSSNVVKQQFEELVALKKELYPTIEELDEVNSVSHKVDDINGLREALNSPSIKATINKGKQYVTTFISLMYFMALCKSYIGKNYKGEDVCFYDEREWRVFSYDLGSTQWVYDTTASDFEKIRAEKNKKLEEQKFFQLLIQPEIIGKIISHIIVPTDDDVPDIIKEIMDSDTIFGHNVTDETKHLIISKVTSFERIEKDY